MRTALVLLLALATAVVAAPSGIGKTTKVVKSADLLRGKSKSAIKENQEVEDNDQIRTQSSGRVRVVLNDGSILSVGSSSLLTVRASVGDVRAGSLDLAYGRIRAVVTSGAPKRFEIRTATALCGVLGTTLFVDGSRDVTRVANLSDEATSRVRVTSTNAGAPGEVILLPGQGTSIPAGRAPQPPRTWSPEEVRAANADTAIP